MQHWQQQEKQTNSAGDTSPSTNINTASCTLPAAGRRRTPDVLRCSA